MITKQQSFFVIFKLYIKLALIPYKRCGYLALKVCFVMDNIPTNGTVVL